MKAKKVPQSLAASDHLVSKLILPIHQAYLTDIGHNMFYSTVVYYE